MIAVWQIAVAAASATWTVASLVWTVRAERTMRSLTRQGNRVEAQLAEATEQIAEFESYLDKTPTLHFRAARERVRQ